MSALRIRMRGKCDPTALMKTAIRDVWKKGAAQQANNVYDGANINFNMMAYQDTDGIGCSYRRCSRYLYIVCFYNIDPAELVPVPGNLYDSTTTTCDGCPTINGVSTCKYDCDIEDEIMDDLKDCSSAALAIPYNFKKYPKYDVSRESALKAVIKEWWSALAKTGVPDNIYVEADMKGKPLGDYVNMAYDKTKKVGCGVQTCKKTGETYVQCGYTVDTPIDDEDPIYKVAKKRACSGCRREGMTCSPLGALCVQQ
ncbi:hypothetical protein ANCCAN_19038 [Ancylostoma caninum]|uniref:SCP domain-containing protein n=1 Tax=Ancylostoma caninum TaxID=29170 RepID=A0A368FVW2_ANCCA|nr:hypothetical protein ANCCAN_19038 [Ancylostoma caninum]